VDDPASFGRWLRERRKVRDISREALARRVGCAVVTIKKIENGERRPSRQIAELILDALAVPSEERTAIVRLARIPSRLVSTAPQYPPLAPADRVLDDLSGRTIRGYMLQDRLGAGGFGVVYRAQQPGIGRAVAIKIILPLFVNLPEFIRRFEAEAQLIARLEHPHIVPLHDFWREPGGAYLVMRYLPGGTLFTLLQRGPLPLDVVAHMLDQVGAALAVAHRAGVIHRDLKPSNILLDTDGNAYLADFGIAKDLSNTELTDQTQPGAILGSPAYLSPEQIKDEPITPRSDIYSLGVMLYELLTGAKPFQASAPGDLIQKHISEPLPALHVHRPDLPDMLNVVIQRATAKTPADRYPDVLSLVAAFRQATTAHPLPTTDNQGQPAVGGQPSAIGDRTTVAFELPDLANPYKGLRAFAEADAANFFGREALVARLLERMAENQEPRINDRRRANDKEHARRNTQDATRFLAVVGPSGSGKSSVVKAGLIPALRRGGLPGSERWFIAEMLPGAHPLEELELALLRLATDRPANLAEQLARDERGLVRAARLVLPPDESELLLVIDQFEETFTLVEDEAARAHFLANIVAAVTDERSQVRVVITLRADFYDRPLLYPELGELVRARTEVVLPLTPDEIEQATVSPSRA
jgi:serine/threonine protein kinase/DNA-binding XRE family transcriptional regulator